MDRKGWPYELLEALRPANRERLLPNAKYEKAVERANERRVLL